MTQSNGINPSWTILHIDDDEDDANLFQYAIAKIASDIELHKETSAREGLDKLVGKVVTPDLIIVDLNIPGMNGFDFIKEASQHAHITNIPIIIFSTSTSPKDKHTAIRLGARQFISKPSSYTEFLQVVTQMVNDWYAR